MKKTFIFLVMAFLLVGTMAVAVESTLIDFSIMDADILPDANDNPTQNKRTVVDFSHAAGTLFTEENKTLMKTSLALPNWEVELNSSARNVSSLTLSEVKAAPVKSSAKVPFAGQNVMGVRILFPTSAVNANAKILPPFEIPAYEPLASADDNGDMQPATEEEKASGKTRFEDGYGVVKNVGTIKAISVSTYGMNSPHSLYVILKDTDNVERRYLMGNLGFDGWKELKWNNPFYVNEIRNREVQMLPIYPRGLPYVKFVGFQITRDAMDDGGDFIGYLKDVKIIYDKSVLVTDRDIADEDLWGIITDKEADRQNAEMSKFGQKQVVRFMEREKAAKETEFTSSLTSDSGNGSTEIEK